MDIDVDVNGDSLPIQIADPFQMDVDRVIQRIAEFLEPKGLAVEPLRLEELLPRMVRGIAGCERGCPADAQSFVRKGFHDYKLEYIEGGILTAFREMATGGRLEIRMFPGF